MTEQQSRPGPVIEGERMAKQRWLREFRMVRQQLVDQARRFGRPIRVVAISPSTWMTSRLRALRTVDSLLVPQGPPLGTAAERVDAVVLHGSLDSWNRRVFLRQVHGSLVLGGRLVVVREFTHRADDGHEPYLFTHFVEELQLATGSGVVLDVLESYPTDQTPIHRAALAAFTRVGVSQTW